jgi:hypothetical protein
LICPDGKQIQFVKSNLKHKILFLKKKKKKKKKTAFLPILSYQLVKNSPTPRPLFQVKPYGINQKHKASGRPYTIL